MRLDEITTDPGNPGIDPSWIRAMGMDSSKIRFTPDKQIVYNGTIELQDSNVSFAYPIHTVTGNVEIMEKDNLTSWTNFPLYIQGSLLFLSCANLCPFSTFKTKVKNHLTLYDTPVQSLAGLPLQLDSLTLLGSVKNLHNVHKVIPNLKVKHALNIDDFVTNVLGLALIPGLRTVVVTHTESQTEHKFDVSDNDPFVFQEQLIDAGFETMAKL